MRIVSCLAVGILAIGVCAVAAGEPTAIPLPVSGLTEADQDAAVKPLAALVRSVYECAQHPQAAADKPGHCAACGGKELVERKIPLFASVTPKPADGALILVPTAGEAVKLSALAAALGDGPVKIDLLHVRLAGVVTLHVSGMR